MKWKGDFFVSLLALFGDVLLPNRGSSKQSHRRGRPVEAAKGFLKAHRISGCNYLGEVSVLGCDCSALQPWGFCSHPAQAAVPPTVQGNSHRALRMKPIKRIA